MAGSEKMESGAKILVVDDEEVVHASLERILGRMGHQVESVLRAEVALAKLKDSDYDLVITDLMMPEVDGLQLLARLRNSGNTIPVLMVTGYPAIKTALQALRLGAIDYIAKPFRRSELLAPVNRALRGSDADPTTGTEQRANGDGTSDLKSGASLSPGDRFFLRQHSWVVFVQDGTMRVGVQESFLRGAGKVVAIELPKENDLVEQGYVAIRLQTDKEEHGVFMPLSGQVVAVNPVVQEDIAAVTCATWLVRILPTRLDQELEVLLAADPVPPETLTD